MFLEGDLSIRSGSGIIGIAQTFSRWDLLAGSLSVFHWKKKQRKIFLPVRLDFITIPQN